jgi:hypothetical protein
VLWGRGIEDFGLVLVLDQFEQVFTQFGAQRGQGLTIDVRDRFFDDLHSILRPAPEDATRLPSLKVVVSMRDDFVAEIDRLEDRIGTIEPAARYHLRPFTPETVAEPVEEGARRFYNVRYADAVIDDIRRLADDDQRILPGHIQIVCSRLWRTTGAQLARSASGGTIGIDAMLDEAGRRIGAREMLDAHFQRILHTNVEDERDDGEAIARAAARSEIEQIEILDMLAPLVTSRGTRNIVDEETLTGAPLRNRKTRERLLELLKRQSILRVEARLGGRFAEVTHEFLIEPIGNAREHFFEDEPDKRQLWLTLDRAVARLQAIEESFRYPSARLLVQDEIEALTTWLEIVDLAERKNGWVAEAIYRSAIHAGLDREKLEKLRSSLERFFPEIDAQLVWRTVRANAAGGRLLDDAELGVIVDDDSLWQRLDADERLFLLRSAIANAQLHRHELIPKLLGRLPCPE